MNEYKSYDTEGVIMGLIGVLAFLFLLPWSIFVACYYQYKQDQEEIKRFIKKK